MRAKCPKKRVMIMCEGGEVVSDDDEAEVTQEGVNRFAHDPGENDEDYACVEVPQCLEVRRNLNITTKVDDKELAQREPFSHPRLI